MSSHFRVFLPLKHIYFVAKLALLLSDGGLSNEEG
jgi:hypothetical protein